MSWRAEVRELMGKPCVVSAVCEGKYPGGDFEDGAERSVEVAERFDPPRKGWVVGCSHLPVGTYHPESWHIGDKGMPAYLKVTGRVAVLRVQFDVQLKPVYALPEHVEVPL